MEFNLFKLNADGSNLLQLTNIGNNLANVWSPDGAQIAFVSDRDDPQSNCGSHGSYATCNAEIYVMNPDGTAQTNITNTPSVDTDPDWQPLRAFDRYPRPGGGTPLQVWFVPAYAPCTSPNTTHAPPLALGSCTPPGRESTLLTTGTIGQQKASVRLDALLGNPGTPADEADIALTSSLRDVRTAAGTDYTGEVLLSTKMRTTDRASGAGVSATMSDFRFDLPLGCTSTPEPSLGSSCSLTTTFDALLAGLAKEGKRSVIATDSFMVMDAGLDGDVSAPSCPPACGTGDEETYLVQGTFLP